MNRAKMRLSKAAGRAKLKQGWTAFEKGPDPSGRVRGAVECWVNCAYVVFICPEGLTAWGNVTRIMIRRNDGSNNVSWCDKQRIKDALFGAESCAVEVFPPESQLVDDANIYHLWILPPGFVLPFGLARPSAMGRELWSRGKEVSE